MTWEQQVGERISLLRKERNLTKAEFGAMIGLSAHYVGRIERGKHTISAAAVNRICDATGVSSDFIIRGTVDPVYTIAAFSGLSQEQAKVTLDIVMNVIKFIGTSAGNHTLLQELLRQHQEIVGADDILSNS